MSGSRNVRTLCAGVAFTAVALAAIFWVDLLAEVGHLGWDTYPILLTSAVSSWSDLIDLAAGRLMPGFYPGEFYRPLTTASVALDRALLGGTARSNALVGAVLLALAALALYRIVRRWLPGAPWAAALATTVFVLHPAQGSVLPYLARRPDLLSATLLLWMVSVLSRADASSSGYRAGLLALGAMLAKEVGLIAPVVAVGVGLLEDRERLSSRGRIGRALRLATAPAIAAGLYVGLRWWVLGGLGGHKTSGWNPDLVAGHVRKLCEALLSVNAVPWWHWAALATAAAAALSLAGGSEGGRRLLLLASGWGVALALLLSSAGRFSPWYAYAGIAPLALALAALARIALTHRQESPLRSAVLVAAVGLLVGRALIGAPQWAGTVELRRAGAESATFLSALGPELAAAEPGTRIEAGPYPSVVRAAVPDRYRQIAVLAPYSIRAWAMLARPGVDIQAGRRRELERSPPAADAITIALGQARKIEPAQLVTTPARRDRSQ